MDFFLITGPQAVGKMTVGEELASRKGYKLFHNHMTIDLVMKLFSYEDGRDLISDFRKQIFEKFEQSNQAGLVFTFLWAFDMQEDWDYIEYLKDLYKNHNFYIVELYAPLEKRLERNTTPNRLSKKWTKRDVVASEKRLRDSIKKHRVTSYDGEVTYPYYIKIDNTNLTEMEVVDQIMKHFNL